jgi:hypothetical protein
MRVSKRSETGGGSADDAAEFARARLGFEADAKQMQALRGGRRGIVNCTRQWGKSTVKAAKAVHRAYLRAGSLTLVLSPSARQSGEFLRKVETFARKVGMRPRGDGDNSMSILLPNGSRIVGLPGNETTVRGFSAVSLLLIDEAARVGDHLYRAMRPTLAVADGDLWLMSTPNGKRGFFWEEWERGTEECARISARFLEEERAKGDGWYRQEYLCEFVEMEGAVFPRALIDGAFEDFGPLAL